MHSIPHLKFLQFLVHLGFFHAFLQSSHFLSETCSIFSSELLPIFCFPKQVERSSTNFLLSNFPNSLQSIFPTLYLFATFYFKINIFEFLSLYLSNEYFIFLYFKILFFSCSSSSSYVVHTILLFFISLSLLNSSFSSLVSSSFLNYPSISIIFLFFLQITVLLFH